MAKSQVEIGAVAFSLHASRGRTIEEACRKPWPQIVAAYRAIANDYRRPKAIDRTRAARVVRLAVERAWHAEVRGSNPSIQLLEEFREAVTAAAPPGRFRTEKDLAFAAIEERLSAEETLLRIRARFPRSKADRHRVYHYRWLYRRERGGA